MMVFDLDNHLIIIFIHESLWNHESHDSLSRGNANSCNEYHNIIRLFFYSTKNFYSHFNKKNCLI